MLATVTSTIGVSTAMAPAAEEQPHAVAMTAIVAVIAAAIVDGLNRAGNVKREHFCRHNRKCVRSRP